MNTVVDLVKIAASRESALGDLIEKGAVFDAKMAAMGTRLANVLLENVRLKAELEARRRMSGPRHRLRYDAATILPSQIAPRTLRFSTLSTNSAAAAICGGHRAPHCRLW
jgi:hypothetical protein